MFYFFALFSHYFFAKFSHFLFRENFAFFRETDESEISRKMRTFLHFSRVNEMRKRSKKKFREKCEIFAKRFFLFAGNPNYRSSLKFLSGWPCMSKTDVIFLAFLSMQYTGAITWGGKYIVHTIPHALSWFMRSRKNAYTG